MTKKIFFLIVVLFFLIVLVVIPCLIASLFFEVTSILPKENPVRPNLKQLGLDSLLTKI